MCGNCLSEEEHSVTISPLALGCSPLATFREKLSFAGCPPAGLGTWALPLLQILGGGGGWGGRSASTKRAYWASRAGNGAGQAKISPYAIIFSWCLQIHALAKRVHLSKVQRRKEAIAWKGLERRTGSIGRSARKEAEWVKALGEEVGGTVFVQTEGRILAPSAAYWNQQEDSH